MLQLRDSTRYSWHSPDFSFHLISCLHSHLPVSPATVRLVLQTRFMSIFWQPAVS